MNRIALPLMALALTALAACSGGPVSQDFRSIETATPWVVGGYR